MVYLDNAATTAPHPQVLKEMQHLYVTCFGNPSSVHPVGQDAEKVLNSARKILARIFKVPLAGIVFCGSGTESDNLAIKGFFQKQQRPLPGIIISPLEHAAIVKTCQWLEERQLAAVSIVNIDKVTGQVDLDHLTRLIDDRTRMVSIQHVNSETGTVQDLAAVSKTAKKINPKILVHSDGVQAFTRIPIDLNQLGIDLYSISAHKFHGVKGSGALILNKQLTPEPLVHGGGQEHGLRSGTENIVGNMAMALAADIAITEMDQNLTRIREFTEQFRHSLKQTFPDCRLYQAPHQVPHIISVSFPGILGEVLLHHLSKQGICVSTGSACNAASKKLSSVLQAIGYSKERIKETIRISIAASEIPEDQELFFKQFNASVAELKTMLT